jgi:TatD DNase family protein
MSADRPLDGDVRMDTDDAVALDGFEDGAVDATDTDNPLPLLIDTHCHLGDAPLCDDEAGVLARAHAAGVGAFVCPSADQPSSRIAMNLARRHPGVVFAAAGLHPGYVPHGAATDLSWLEAMIANGGLVAVGEIGLDAAVPDADLDAQERAFLAQARLAREAGLPILVHVRNAFERVVRVLESLGPGGPGGVLHAFGGSAELAARLLRLGFLRGVGGTATRPGSTRIRRAVAATPLNAIVLETDAPYIGTDTRPAGRVEPADLPEVAHAVAGLLGLPVGTVAAATTANARRLLGGHLEARA